MNDVAAAAGVLDAPAAETPDAVRVESFEYDNRTVRDFAVATAFWGLVGMLAGLVAAIQLVFPAANAGVPEITFGRLRPVHTNAVIFAFVGNGMFAGIYYSVQRLCKSRMWSDLLSRLNFWGWQLVIVAAAVTLPLGMTTSKEYAELEWPVDLLITVIWVVFSVNLIATIVRRRERHMYVALWFYVATAVTVAVLHLVNSVAIPVSLGKSYSAYAGVQDALVQWWYGHNAVAFFLTTPYLGLMYYFLPKAANRPVFSYRLSIIHFWALVFIYIWAGPHHLLYTALPDWAQSLGMVFSLMLIAPSWGGMLNGLLTLRGAWDKVREEPVLKFFVVAVTFYGMATLEGPMMAIKSVNALSHFTDWTIAHVHGGALGWNGYLTFGMLYWLVPRLYRTALWSRRLANTHFWLGLVGILFYIVPMYWAGVTQGLMWKQFDTRGFLQYPNFLETVREIAPMYALRGVGGALYLAGAVLMAVNLWRTARGGRLLANEPAQAPALVRERAGGEAHEHPWRHRWLEAKPVLFTVLTTVAILVGGIVELLPTFLMRSNVPTIASVHPYTPLELTGRDLYIREGCSVCHSQMVRPFRSETERYGEYSKAGEFVYDHPFLWGSKRTGPDLHRVGGKYPDAWHLNHLVDPQTTSPGSIMPPYPWLAANAVDLSTLERKITALRRLGVPYPEGYEARARQDLESQARAVAANLEGTGANVAADSEVVALIAYLQRLGTDIARPATAAAAAPVAAHVTAGGAP
jgi:cytochrome c oxidase cbb3-type subunit I/II